MPFCTECGARHAESDRICPNCGESIAAPPDEDLDDVLASLDRELEQPGQADEDEEPAISFERQPEMDESAGDFGREVTPDYIDQIDQVRASIAAQSTALQELDDLTWTNPRAALVRDELAAAVDQLHALTPPEDLASAHREFMHGAELLLDGFRALVDASDDPDGETAIEQAQEAIAEASQQFRRGANALNAYMAGRGTHIDDDLLAGLDDLVPAAAEPEQPAEFDEELERELAGLDLGLSRSPESTPQGEPEPEFEIDEPLEEPAFQAQPVAPAWSAPAAARPPPQSVPPPFSAQELHDQSVPKQGAWPELGDSSSDALLREIEGGWVRGRPLVHEALERTIRAAVSDALRGATETRLRIEQEARTTLSRIAGERARLVDEVESLRREAHVLQSELADLRRALNELERERQNAQDRRHQMFQEAEGQRDHLLQEIEQLGGQLNSMRENIVSLLNMSTAPSLFGRAQSEASAFSPPVASAPSSSRLVAPEVPAAESLDAHEEAPAAAEMNGEVLTDVRISGVSGVTRNVQIQRTLRSLAGVQMEGAPRFRNGTLSVTLKHRSDFDLSDALLGLPDANLAFEGMPEPGVLEFTSQ